MKNFEFDAKLKNYDNIKFIQHLINRNPSEIDNYLNTNNINLNRNDMYFEYKDNSTKYTNYLIIVINNNRDCMIEIIQILLKHGIDHHLFIKNALDIWKINNKIPFPSK
jgi:hypothetical protein